MNKINDYKNNINVLFDKWKKKVCNIDNYVFFRDGIVCPEEWFNEGKTVRPLFLLKEAYAKNSEKCEIDETKWLSGTYKDKIKDQTFKRIIDWSKIILKDSSLSEYNWDDNIFKSIALMNIKKYDGHSISINKDLIQHADKFKELIFEQIRIINPTIIICGYTRWLLDYVLNKLKKKTIKQKSNINYIYKTDVFETGNEITVIDFWHPSCRKKSDELKCVLQRIIEKADSDDWNDERCVIDLKHVEKSDKTKAEKVPVICKPN